MLTSVNSIVKGRIEVVIKPSSTLRSLAARSGNDARNDNELELDPIRLQKSIQKSMAFGDSKGEEGAVDKEREWINQARYSGCRNDRAKPPYSYASLIAQAILDTPSRKLTLVEIYQWIMGHYPYYQSQNSGWQNSIRHNLSLNRCFVKVQKSGSKGSYWTIDEGLMGELNQSGLFKRRKHRTEKRRYTPSILHTAHLLSSMDDFRDKGDDEEKEEDSASKEQRDGNVFLDIAEVFDRDNAEDARSNIMVSVMECTGDCNQASPQSMRAPRFSCPELTEDDFELAGQMIILSSEFY